MFTIVSYTRILKSTTVACLFHFCEEPATLIQLKYNKKKYTMGGAEVVDGGNGRRGKGNCRSQPFTGYSELLLHITCAHLHVMCKSK